MSLPIGSASAERYSYLRRCTSRRAPSWNWKTGISPSSGDGGRDLHRRQAVLSEPVSSNRAQDGQRGPERAAGNPAAHSAHKKLPNAPHSPQRRGKSRSMPAPAMVRASRGIVDTAACRGVAVMVLPVDTLLAADWLGALLAADGRRVLRAARQRLVQPHLVTDVDVVARVPSLVRFNHVAVGNARRIEGVDLGAVLRAHRLHVRDVGDDAVNGDPGERKRDE